MDLGNAGRTVPGSRSIIPGDQRKGRSLTGGKAQKEVAGTNLERTRPTNRTGSQQAEGKTGSRMNGPGGMA